MLAVKGKQLSANNHFKNKCIVTLTFVLLTPKSICHILHSWRVFAWRFMIICVKGIKLYNKLIFSNQFIVICWYIVWYYYWYWLFSETGVGCTALFFVKTIWCLFCIPPPPLLSLCIALFAVAEGWPSLDIGYLFWSWIICFRRNILPCLRRWSNGNLGARE